jgi:hypothetical protein
MTAPADDLGDFIRRWAAAFGETLTREEAQAQRQAEADLYAWLKAGGDRPGDADQGATAPE